MNKKEIYNECLKIENCMSKLKSFASVISQISETFKETLQDQHTIFFCGNGGSAADSQHIAAEFTGRFLKERDSWPAVALTTNTSVLTAIGNDYSYNDIFSRQISGLMKPKDILVCISTSGESKNILNAASEAKKIGSKVVAFTGQKECSLSRISDICFAAPSEETPRIQELHIASLHIICQIVENSLYEIKK